MPTLSRRAHAHGVYIISRAHHVHTMCYGSVPDPTHYARKGLVTFEGFLGCAHPHVLIQQARDLHVRIHFVYKIFTVSACREPVYVCVASLFSVLLINCQRSQISRSDQGRSDNGVYACANAYL